MTFERAVSGRKTKLSASTWNDVMDMVRERNSRRLSQGEIDLSTEDVLWIRNAGDDTLQQFAIVGVGEPTVKPAVNDAEWRRRHSFHSAAPVAGEKFAIVQSPLEADTVGIAKTFGISKCLIDVSDTTHAYAGPDDGDYDKLVSQADAGPATIYFLDVPEDTALDGGIDAVVTELTVVSSTGWPAVPFVATIDDEDLLVTEVDGETWTVTRGHGATDEDSHDDEAVVEFKSGVVQAAVLLDQNNTVAITSINGDTTAAQIIESSDDSISVDSDTTPGTTDLTGTTIVEEILNDPAAGPEWVIDEREHQLNIPDASATARGAVNTGTQDFVGRKGFDEIHIGGGTWPASATTPKGFIGSPVLLGSEVELQFGDDYHAVFPDNAKGAHKKWWTDSFEIRAFDDAGTQAHVALWFEPNDHRVRLETSPLNDFDPCYSITTGLAVTYDGAWATVAGMVFKGGLYISGAASIALGSDVSGTLPVANGGSGRTTLDAGQLIAGNGTSAVESIEDTRVIDDAVEFKVGTDRWARFGLGSF